MMQSELPNLHDGNWVDRADAAKIAGVSPFYLQKIVATPKGGPPYVRLGRKCWYRVEEVRCWAKSLKGQRARALTLSETKASPDLEKYMTYVVGLGQKGTERREVKQAIAGKPMARLRLMLEEITKVLADAC